jgi:hypothetical protein
MSPTSVPILFIVFNRPDVTAEVFAAIRQAAPARLYVAADGPRDRPGEADACEAVRAIATAVDWDCTVETLFQDSNLGCRRGVQAAIDWFFTREESGIILEDDCQPDPSFFPFVAELLDRYRDDPRVMMISGDYFAGDEFTADTSYFFTRNTHIWGWATWRRAWQHFDAELSSWPERRTGPWLLDAFSDDPHATAYWTDIFDRVHRGEVDTWDYSWTYSMWQAGGLAAQATRNLISNIGFGPEATHTIDSSASRSRLAVSHMPFPLTHPATVEQDTARDSWTDINVFGTRPASIGRRIMSRVRALR